MIPGAQIWTATRQLTFDLARRTLNRPGTSIPYRIDCHQWSAASDANGIEVVVVRVDEAPAFNSAKIRCLATGKSLAKTLSLLAADMFRTSSPTASTALPRAVVVTYS